MKKELKDAIIKKQGDLLYTTLSEECAELIQACSKIIRDKRTGKNNFELFDNMCEEINDVEMNLELIKSQMFKDYLVCVCGIDENIVVNNMCEEINDVEMNLELIKSQMFKDYLVCVYGIDENIVVDKIEEWNRIKTEKLNKIFLKDKKNEL